MSFLPSDKDGARTFFMKKEGARTFWTKKRKGQWLFGEKKDGAQPRFQDHVTL